jgi:hypothetical protein
VFWILIHIIITHSLLEKGRDPLTMGCLDNFDNGSPNKYEKKIKKKNLWIYFSTYRLMVIEILYNFIIVC